MTSRRPLKTRSRAWARRLATGLAKAGIPPNAISAFSLLPAALAAYFFLILPHIPPAGQVVVLLLAAGCIQLRLLANMLDGLVAVEGGRKSPTGDLFNEVPDRLADVLILAPIGYSLPELGIFGVGVTLSWLAALLAVLTAYVRLFGGSLGFPQSFIGPMAKQHRMATLTVTCLVSIAEVLTTGYHGKVLTIGLLIICFGSLVTIVRRLLLIASQLMDRQR
jgi:phosphatidylglycerophosphate synthase